ERNEETPVPRDENRGRVGQGQVEKGSEKRLRRQDARTREKREHARDGKHQRYVCFDHPANATAAATLLVAPREYRRAKRNMSVESVFPQGLSFGWHDLHHAGSSGSS